MNTILPSLTYNILISEMYEMDVLNNLNWRILPKYEEKFNKQHNDTLVKNKPNKSYNSTSTKCSKIYLYSEPSSDRQYIEKLV